MGFLEITVDVPTDGDVEAILAELQEGKRPSVPIRLADGYYRFEALVRLGRTHGWFVARRGDKDTTSLLVVLLNSKRGMPFGVTQQIEMVKMVLISLANKGTTLSDTRSHSLLDSTDAQ